MDKYEYNVKIDQIRQAVGKKDIKEAVKIADEIDWKREKDTSVLIMVSGAYEVSKQYTKAKELLLLAYEKSQSGRQLAYRLALISAKTKEFDEAIEFYHDFVEMAPRDTARYVLQYRIAKAKGEPIEYLIEILEEYVNIDMEEKWMFELAKLYHMAGDQEKCVDLCDEMSLWFSHGDYVRRALDLKMKYRPLTKRQMENYHKTDEEMMAELRAREEVKKAEETASSETKEKEEEDIGVDRGATIPFTTLNVAQFHGATKEEKTEVQPEENEKRQVEEEISIPAKEQADNEVTDTTPIPGEIDIEDIHVKQFEGNGSDTMDIQAVIAKNIQEIMESEAPTELPEKEEKEDLDKITMTLDPLYKYDSNGQIGLDIAEPEKKDKQITGQLSIEDVLRNLEERGILKADTVNKTVETMDQAAEAVDKAATEAAIRAEDEKNNETIIEDLSVKDLADESEMADVKMALESYADDAANGFVFTDEIDSAAIEKALQDSEAMISADTNTKEIVSDENIEKIVVEDTIASDEADTTEEKVEISEDSKSDEKAIEDLLLFADKDEDIEEDMTEETPVELESVPVLDLSFEVPVKKLQPGLTPASAPVPANTESLKELFADLDEATKRDIGIFEEREKVVPEEVAEDGATEESEASNVSEAANEATSNEDTENAVEEAKESSEQVTATEEKTEAVEEGNVAEESDKEDVAEETLEEANTSEAEEVSETVVSEDAENVVGQEEVPMDVSLSDTASEDNTDETTETQKEEKPVPTLSDMPVVKVSTNKNITQTLSLNLDKIMISDDEMKPFESFKTVSGLEQKIRDTVMDLVTSYEGLGTSKTGNIMILGDEKSGKTTMAIELIKLINKKRERNGRRIAKVDSSVLNTRGIRSSMKKLIGSDLIVENAQHLRKSILAEFVSVGHYYTDNMLIIFEGETSALKTMRNESEEIARMFDHILVIKEYDVKEWVAYAKKYAATKNYMIDEMGTLALYKSIDDFYGKHQGIEQSDVENIINRAIKKASSKMGRKLTNLFSGKNDDSGMDIIKEVDFK